MARLLHWSDLHTEFGNFELPDIPGNIDALLLGGDTGTGTGHVDFLEKAWNKYQVPIISIWGNHEAYGTSFSALRKYEDAVVRDLNKKGADIRILHAETTKVKDTVIFGATLWTDFELYPQQTEFAKVSAKRCMADYRHISAGNGGKITPDDTISMHHKDRAKLVDTLRLYKHDNLVVMTHHMPHEVCVSDRFKNDGITPAFCSDLEEEILTYSPDFWIFGHTHDGNEYDIPTDDGFTRLRHNPRGYPTEFPKIFDPYRIIDTDNPELKRL